MKPVHGWVALLMALVCSATVGAADSPRYAFLVGCGGYDDEKTGLRPLKFACRDILAFRDALVRSQFPESNIITLKDGEEAARLPHHANIQRELDKLLARVEPSATVLIALSGHGIHLRGDKEGSYFCPLDARVAEGQNLLALDAVYEKLRTCPARHKLLVVDACRDEPALRHRKGKHSLWPEVDLEVRPTRTVPGGVLALYSCRPGEASYEHPQLRQSVFFHFLLEGWEGAADADGNGQVTVDELQRYTREQTSRFVEDKWREWQVTQVPVFRGELAEDWVISQATAELRCLSAAGTGSDGVEISVAVAPDGRRALSAGCAGIVRLWDVASGQVVRVYKDDSGQLGWVFRVAFAPDARTFAAAHASGAVLLWDVESGKVKHRLMGHVGDVYALAFTPDGQRVLTGGEDRLVRIWDTATGQEVQELRGHSQAIRSLALTADGRRAASAGNDQTICIWNMHDGRLERTLRGHDSVIRTVAFTPDGLTLVSAAGQPFSEKQAGDEGDGAVRLWSLVTGQELRPRFPAATKAVLSVTFSPDGRYMVTTGADRSVRVWDVASRKELRSYQRHTDAVLSAAITPDGRVALTSSADRTVRLWSLPRACWTEVTR